MSRKFFVNGYRVSTLLASAAACIVGGAVHAQESEQDQAQEVAASTGVEDIIVTAQRQSQNLQKVPIAITAVTGDSLINRGIRTSDDLNIAVPGLNVSRSISTGLLYLRGVGNNSTNPGQEPNVGFYVDGVYYATVVSDLSSFSKNVDHIEVLKGPQGTLFGRNTTGGLIQVVTKDPSHDTGGSLSVGYGNYDTVSTSGYVTTGLTDSLAADFSFNFVNQGDGWGRNISGGDANYRDDLNLRTKWVWEASDRTKMTLAGDYNRIKSDLGSARQILAGIPRTPASLGSIVFNGNIYDTQSDSRIGDRIEGGGASVRIDHEADPFRLVSISAYRKLRRVTYLDLDATTGPVSQAVYSPQKAETFSQEVQILSPSSSTVQWIAGVYIFHAEDGVYPLLISNPGTGRFTRISDKLTTDSFAGFAQVTFPLFGDSTHLTAGARYTIDDKRVSGTISTNAGLLAVASQHASFSEPTFRVALDHQFTADILGYVSVNTGFKSGLYNATSPTSPAVRPEKITAYEGGLKMQLLDDKVRLNLAGFYYDYKDLQLTRFTGTTTQLQNAANAELYGAEAEIEARVSDGLRLTGGISWTHSEYTSFPGAVSFAPNPVTGLGQLSIIDAAGNQLLRTPKITGNVALDYRHPVGSGEIGTNVSYYYNDGFYFDPDNIARQPSYQLVNAELSYAGADNAYKVRLWGKNLFNEKYFSNITSGNGTPAAGSPAAPRTYGVTVEVNF